LLRRQAGDRARCRRRPPVRGRPGTTGRRRAPLDGLGEALARRRLGDEAEAPQSTRGDRGRVLARRHVKTGTAGNSARSSSRPRSRSCPHVEIEQVRSRAGRPPGRRGSGRWRRQAGGPRPGGCRATPAQRWATRPPSSIIVGDQNRRRSAISSQDAASRLSAPRAATSRPPARAPAGLANTPVRDYRASRTTDDDSARGLSCRHRRCGSDLVRGPRAGLGHLPRGGSAAALCPHVLSAVVSSAPAAPTFRPGAIHLVRSPPFLCSPVVSLHGRHRPSASTPGTRFRLP